MTERARERFDVVIVGAGFAGLYALHRMRQLGFETVVLEAGSGIGGTWYWNAYPGARCDVASFEYSYSFDAELQDQWRWSERFAKQPEILAYLEHVADRLKLKPDIRLDTRVETTRWKEEDSCWLIDTTAGTLESRFLLMASGSLSKPNLPAIDGLDVFRGSLFHSSRWPRHEIELAGKRVGVVGTGSSGVQIIGNIAAKVGELYVFQRRPHWVVPAGNRPISDEEDRRKKAGYAELRRKLGSSLLGMDVDSGGGNAIEANKDERARRYEARWQEGGPGFLMSFDDLLFSLDSNATACEFLARKIRSIVRDPNVAEELIPNASDYPIGSRRLINSDRYYESFNRPNVHLVDVREDPICRLSETGIVLESGKEIDLDIIVLATGFDALTGAMLDMEIVGRDGISLGDKWAEGPSSYLGIALEGFPNLFTITGPGSPSVLSNMVLSIEQHVDFVAQLLDWMREHEVAVTEPEREFETRWGRKVYEVAMPTVFSRAVSWYWGANVEGKPEVFMPYLGGVGTYREECDQIARNNYEGFSFR